MAESSAKSDNGVDELKGPADNVKVITQSDLLGAILTGKLKANDKRCMSVKVTESPSGGWYDAVLEAREHGVSIKSFGDTRDKIVLHPGHLNYDFDYYWGRHTWSRKACWDDDVKEETKLEANEKLFAIARELVSRKDGTWVWIVFPSGSEKGYLSTRVLVKSSWKHYKTASEMCDDVGNDDMVLFVFGAVAAGI